MYGNDDHCGLRPPNLSGVTCDQCGVVCQSAIDLARHLVLHDDDGSANPPVMYTCSSCNRKFRYLKHLTRHHQSCRGEAHGSLARSSGRVSSTTAASSSSYQCNVCGRQFTQCGALRRHERVHSGELPHACGACGRRFTQKCTRDRHVMLVHDGNVGGSTDETVRSSRQSRGRRGGDRSAGGDGAHVAAATTAADVSAGTVSSRRQSRCRPGRRGGGVATAFASERSRLTSSPPSLFSDEEGEDGAASGAVNSIAGCTSAYGTTAVDSSGYTKPRSGSHVAVSDRAGSDSVTRAGAAAVSATAASSRSAGAGTSSRSSAAAAAFMPVATDAVDGTCGADSATAIGSKAAYSLDDDDGSDNDMKQVASEGCAQSASSLSSDRTSKGVVDKYSDVSSGSSAEAADDPRRPHKCTRCGYAFKLAAHLKQHVAALHSGRKRPYACDTCGRRYRTQGALHSHKVMHSSKMRYRCRKCGCCFARKWSLQRHALLHSRKQAHRCLLCGQRFAQLVNLQLHLRSTHARERPYQCSKCDGRFATAVKLRRHKSTVHSTRSASTLVSRQSKRQLLSDRRGVQRPAVPSSLEPASGSTSDVSTVPSAVDGSRAKANASGMAVTLRATSASGATSEMKECFVCRMCSTRFDCKRNLWRHEKAHIAPRLHGCLQCGKCFKQRGNLYRHERQVHQRLGAQSAAAADVSRSQTSDHDGDDNVDNFRNFLP